MEGETKENSKWGDQVVKRKWVAVDVRIGEKYKSTLEAFLKMVGESSI